MADDVALVSMAAQQLLGGRQSRHGTVVTVRLPARLVKVAALQIGVIKRGASGAWYYSEGAKTTKEGQRMRTLAPEIKWWIAYCLFLLGNEVGSPQRTTNV